MNSGDFHSSSAWARAKNAWAAVKRQAHNIEYALRTAVAAVAALYTAMWLQLDVPSWAMWTVIIISPPVRGDVVRKTTARAFGTLIGCIAAVVLAGLFHQDRVGYVLGLGVWIGVCSFAAIHRKGYVAYAAILAGFTAAIVGIDTDSDPLNTFITALNRGSATVVGVVFASLASALVHPSDDVPTHLVGQLRHAAQPLLQWAAARLANDSDVKEDAPCTGPLLALDAAIIDARAERPTIGRVCPWIIGVPTALLTLQSAVLELARQGNVRERAALPPILARAQSVLEICPPARVADLRTEIEAIARDKSALKTPSARDICDSLTALFSGMEAVLTLQTPAHPFRQYPGIVVAPEKFRSRAAFVRAVVAVIISFLIWDATAWDAGNELLTFTALSVIVSVNFDDPVDGVTGFYRGNLIGGIVGVIILFSVVPHFDGPISLACILVPVMAVTSWLQAVGFQPIAAIGYGNGLTLALNLTNPQQYDLIYSVERILALFAGSLVAAFVYVLINVGEHGQARVQHTLASMRQDVESAMDGRWNASEDRRFAWETRMYEKIRRIHIAGGDADARQAAIALLLTGRAALLSGDSRSSQSEASRVLFVVP
jgi:uncharacterized membrane protein YccC